MRLWILVLCTACLMGVEPGGDLISEADWAKSAPIGAAAPASSSTAVGRSVPVGPSIATLAGGLVVVLGLALGLGWAAKRLGMRRLVQGRGRHLQAIETIPIGFKRQAALLRFGDQVIVVGLGEHECCHLGTFSASMLGEVNPPAPVPIAPVAAPQPSAFAGLLSQITQGKRP